MSPLQWRGVVTERDGVTPCFVRLATIAGIAGYVGMTLWAIAHGQQPSYTEWAMGFTAIVAGGAGAARLKLETEGAAQ